MNIKKLSLIHAFTAFALFALILFGFKSYALWAQVELLWFSGANPFAVEKLTDLGPHALRYLLAFPLFIISYLFDVNYNSLFSLLVPIFLYTVIRNVWAIIGVVSQGQKHSLMSALFISALFFTLFMNMNGRITFAFFGYSIVLRILAVAHYRNTKIGFDRMLLLLLGLMFCSVSSGTFMSAFMLIFLAIGTALVPLIIQLRLGAKTLSFLILALLPLYIFGQFIIIGINKNIAFFGGGIEGFVNMLGHGAGKILIPLLEILPLSTLLTIAVLGGIIGIYAIRAFKYPYLLLQTLCALSIGIFGYSTLSLITMPASACFVLVLFRGVRAKRHRQSPRQQAQQIAFQ